MSATDALRLADDMRATAAQIELCIRPLVAAYGLTNKAYEALARLQAAAGALPLKSLVHALRLERSQVIRCVDELERQLLVRRVRSPLDRRAATVQLTEAGQRLVLAMERGLKGPLSRLPAWPLAAMGHCLLGG
ncbi:MarR family winged helix-turn-helix transcriptional regulator [Hydrogenophaga sp. OTU3427]|uniref:MarR family winged helix-turn-helix transcriptional regulator n=1 Tax=Hydrogenophaga sp. OTU3427 TaxID=3043856 RepID=UPI00313C588D